MSINRGIAVLLAALLDLLGEPPARWHPVAWYGKLIRLLERYAPSGNIAQFIYGIAMLVIAAPFALLPSMFIQRLVACMYRETTRRGLPSSRTLLGALIEGSALKPFFALRMLADAGKAVREPLVDDDLPTARLALRSLVSRDRSQLTAQQTAVAAIESLAENLSDSVVAPLFYYALFGLPGAATYRLCNTFDSMLGYHGRYEYLGKAAARLDDVLNLLPSRLTALLIIECAPLFGGDSRAAWKIWQRDAHKTASPNAGQPMAAIAGALHIQLEKVDHYLLGDHEQDITPEHIEQAEQMVWRTGGIVLLLVVVCRTFWSKRYGR